jgi:hypothetical protein
MPKEVTMEMMTVCSGEGRGIDVTIAVDGDEMTILAAGPERLHFEFEAAVTMEDDFDVYVKGLWLNILRLADNEWVIRPAWDGSINAATASEAAWAIVAYCEAAVGQS